MEPDAAEAGDDVDNRPHAPAGMLEGRRVRLLPVREADLDRLYEANIAVRNRGAHFPLVVMSEPGFRREFAEHGFWQTCCSW